MIHQIPDCLFTCLVAAAKNDASSEILGGWVFGLFTYTAELYFDRISEMFPGRHACFDWMYEKFPMHNAANNFHSVVFACGSDATFST